MAKKNLKRTRKNISRRNKSKKQSTLVMIGCSKKNKKSLKNNKFFSSLGINSNCTKCGPNCRCGPNCKCKHPCPGNCYLNNVSKKMKGGNDNCGSCGCPIAPYPMKGGNYFTDTNKPVIIDNSNNDKFVGILGTGQNGGCTSCSLIPVNPQYGGCAMCNNNLANSQYGGSFYKPIGPMPGPFVGSPIGSKPETWPGMNGVGSDRNYNSNYANVIQNDPQQQMSMNDSGYLTKRSMVGGYTYDKNSKSKSISKGGGLIPQDLVNIGRDFTYNLKSAYNSLNGYSAPVSPLPYKDQMTGALNNSKLKL